MRKIMLAAAFLICALPARAQAPTGFTKLANVTVLTYTDTACANLSTCYYVVTAVDANGFESAPASCDATALCVGGTEAAAVMPSSGTHTVTLTWTTSSTLTVSYNVYVHRGALPPTNLKPVVN
jgi:fibronectin type 3 domain-containing protein